MGNGYIFQQEDTGMGYMQLQTSLNNPDADTATNRARMYMKGDKIVFSYLHNGSTVEMHYFTMDLSSLATTWTESSNAP